MNRWGWFVIGFMLVVSFGASAVGTVSAEPPPAAHRVLNQSAVPVEITDYTARYQERSRYRS